MLAMPQLRQWLFVIISLFVATSAFAAAPAPPPAKPGERVEVNRGDVWYKGTVQSATRYSIRVILDVDGNVLAANTDKVRPLDEATSTAVGKAAAVKSGFTA